MFLGKHFRTDNLIQAIPEVVAATEAVRISSREAVAAVAAGKFRLCASSLQLASHVRKWKGCFGCLQRRFIV